MLARIDTRGGEKKHWKRWWRLRQRRAENQSKGFFTKYPRNWSRGVTSWYLINRIHVTSCQLSEYRRLYTGMHAGSVAPARFEPRTVTKPASLIASRVFSFPNERPHRRTRSPTTSQKFLITRSVIIAGLPSVVSIAEFRNKVRFRNEDNLISRDLESSANWTFTFNFNCRFKRFFFLRIFWIFENQIDPHSRKILNFID